MSLPAGILESVDQAIRLDDVLKLNELLARATKSTDDSEVNLPPILMLNLLQSKGMHRSAAGEN